MPLPTFNSIDEVKAKLAPGKIAVVVTGFSDNMVIMYGDPIAGHCLDDLELRKIGAIRMYKIDVSEIDKRILFIKND